MFNKLVELGQYPLETSDTVTILEKIGHFLDEENEVLYRRFKAEGWIKKEISQHIADNLDIAKIIERASAHWDGGYAIAGMLGHGDAFAFRDPHGIRPVFYYHDDEVMVITSERPAIQTAFNVPVESVKEIKPGHALIIKKNGEVGEFLCSQPGQTRSCSFERIYFSRGTDADIYKERKKLGAYLAPAILETVNYDFANTVFSYIPNTAAVAFYGLLEELNSFCNNVKKERLLREKDNLSEEIIKDILLLSPRMEKVAVKDIKLRTFITQDTGRDDLVAHVYDVTYGIIRQGLDSLVVLDDSIVRGTTLRQSIIRILDRIGPKHIVIASSAPQIRYPDCYGIDMAKLGDFIAFNAAIGLLKETRQSQVINEVYMKCKKQEHIPKEDMVNYVKEIYKPFTATQIAEKIARLVRPKDVKANVSIIFNSIENLHQACPNHKGDWYFTGDYPTPGGNKVVNSSFINYIEGKDQRAY
ncbi:MAG: amidophosphoribosyltransferase [Bacteroidales bacterium]|nr:amidophosphoribosyltransferase [Bacteroidales bacterium]